MENPLPSLSSCPGGIAAESSQAVRTSDSLTLGEVVDLLNCMYPPDLAEGWDSIGLITGDPQQPVRKALMAVDPVAAVVDEAIELGVDLVITHHPLFLRPVHSFAADTFKGDVVYRLTRAGIALCNAHTNADSAPRGVADALAAAIGVEARQALIPRAYTQSQVLTPTQPLVGLGRVGYLPTPMTLRAFAEQVARALPTTNAPVRVAGDLEALVQKVAVLGGSGDSFFDAVRSSNADVYVTADLRHHPASELRERAEFEAAKTGEPAKPYLVDVSHFASEWLWLEAAADDLAATCANRLQWRGGGQVEVIVSERNTDPWALTLLPQ